MLDRTEAEVLCLLGEADENAPTSFKRSRGPYPPESTLVYYLGVELMDDNWLVISLDNGVVCDHHIDVT
jgi:predicted RNA-binding protein